VAEIVLDRVSKAFGGGETLAVDEVSLEIESGEFLVLVGPSGCGKSTLLRMIAGLEDVTDGAIMIDARDVTELPPRARDIAMVFQTYALYPHMTVRENLGYGLKVRKLAKAEIRQRVDQVADMLGLEQMLDRRPAALSGGQRQRVAVARALIGRPLVVLADEPTGNLDSEATTAVLRLFASLRAEGHTLVIVSHESRVAATADRVLTMRDGMLVGQTRLTGGGALIGMEG
jgi:ABC-type sugar transport system ATPase subunit